jgi:hypothetical protein
VGLIILSRKGMKFTGLQFEPVIVAVLNSLKRIYSRAEIEMRKFRAIPGLARVRYIRSCELT